MPPRPRSGSSPYRLLRDKTLNEIEGRTGSEIAAAGLKTPLVVARSTPIGQLTANQAEWLLLHGRSISYVLPRALELAEEDPWRCADYYDGDLLLAVLEVDAACWPPGIDWQSRLRTLASEALRLAELRDDFGRDDETEARLRRWLEANAAPGAARRGQ